MAYPTAVRKISAYAQEVSNADTETVLLSFISVNIILFAYTLPGISVPLSVSQLVFAAVLGSSLTRKHMNAETDTIREFAAALFLNPVIAFTTAYLLFSSVGGNVLTTEHNMLIAPSKINITIPVILLGISIVLMALMAYLLRENRLKIKAQKQALHHQEILFENQKSIAAMEVKTILLENESLNTKLELKRQELTRMALSISEQKTFIETTHKALKNIRETSSLYEKNRKTEDLAHILQQKMNFSQEIESFYSEIENLHKDFNIRLLEQHPNLTENDRRLVTLLRLGFSTKHISSLNNISPKSVEIARYRLRSKLGLQHNERLNRYLQSI